MPPSYVYPNTPDSLQYSLMVDPYQTIGFSPGNLVPCPPEYEPITLSVVEDIDDIFIEPTINAVYFQMVDLQIGGQWLISDPEGRGLYLCRVASKRVNKQAGTVSYTFNTLMQRLNSHEPAGVVISAADAVGSENATPNQVLSYLFGRWGGSQGEVKELSLATPPDFELRGATGPIVPYVIFLSVQQQVGQSLSIREWLGRFFSVFEGYSYRLNGGAFTVLPPMYMQTESVLLSPASVGTPGALVLAEDVTTSDASVINSQTVSHRPYILQGEFLKDPVTGEPTDALPGSASEDGQAADLPTIAEPVYYRQGDTDLVAKPADRRRLKKGEPAAYTFTEELYPLTPPVRVTWTAYVFMNIKENDASVKTVDVTEGKVVMQTHVIDIGPVGAYFDAVTRWIDGSDSAVWVWRLQLTKRGVRAVLIEPTGDTTYEGIVNDGFLNFRPDKPYTLGAEFHMNVQGQAWVKSNVTYSATYGVYTPPTLPPGVEVPPIETASDAATDATEPIYGRRPGADKVIDIWSLVSQSAGGTGAIRDGDDEAVRELVSRTLLDIAQHAVKERLLPYETVSLQFMRPFPVTVADIGRMATYFERTGLIRSYSLQEQHSLAGSEVTCDITLRVPQTAERQTITFVPVTPPTETPYTPPGYPADGDFTGEGPYVPEPITAGPGNVQLDLGRRFDLLTIKADGVRRIRLYRTDTARTEDAARAETEVITVGTTEYTVNTRPADTVFDQLILEARLPYGGQGELELHSLLGHVPEGVTYANIEGGPVTLFRFTPEGRLDQDEGAP